MRGSGVSHIDPTSGSGLKTENLTPTRRSMNNATEATVCGDADLKTSRTGGDDLFHNSDDGDEKKCNDGGDRKRCSDGSCSIVMTMMLNARLGFS
ncbi:hypothetical protein L1887_28647 [Cichorium endivia]|nr:hypothetical protein L1887_28647 [Cichorium endivia]